MTLLKDFDNIHSFKQRSGEHLCTQILLLRTLLSDMADPIFKSCEGKNLVQWIFSGKAVSQQN